MSRPRRILTLGHSYVVCLNRRLAHEMARVGDGRWEVTCAAPEQFVGAPEVVPITLETHQSEPCPVVGLPARLTRHVHVFSYGFKLRSLLHQGWDLVHAWEEPYILAGWQIAQWVKPEALLVYRTAQNMPKLYPPPFCWFEQASMHRAAGWICSGKLVLDNLSHRPGYGQPRLLSPLGVDPNVFYPSPSARLEVLRRLGWCEPGPPVVGFLGRFVPEKGLRLLMRALDLLDKPWRALFLGSGPLGLEIAAWAEKHGDRVRVLRVEHPAVAAHLNAMDILCAPSQTTPHWREQFGRMVVESFACGIPVIGSDSGEMTHLLNDVGVVVNERSPEQWSQAISTLLDSPQMRADLSHRGLDAVHARYAWPLIARQYLNFFDQVAGG